MLGVQEKLGPAFGFENGGHKVALIIENWISEFLFSCLLGFYGDGPDDSGKGEEEKHKKIK